MEKPEEPIHQRINFLIAELEEGVQRRFAKRVGVAAGVVNDIIGARKSKPGFDLISKILHAYPQIRAEWFVRGEGEMLKSSEGPKNYSVSSGRPTATADPATAYVPVARVLTIDEGENRAAPLYNFKTAASYLTGYHSQERPEPEGYLSMPHWLLKNGDYAIFPVIGDSMEPTFFAGDYVVCRAISRGQWPELAADTVACIVSESRGLQLKRLKLRPAEHLIRCKSDNRSVPAFNLPLGEVLEIWRFEWRLSANAANLSDTVFAKVDKLEDDVSDLRELLESVIDIKELKRLQARKNPNE